MQGASVQQAQEIVGIGAFTSIASLADNHTGREDDQRFWMLHGIGQDAARLGQTLVHPVAGGRRSNKRV